MTNFITRPDISNYDCKEIDSFCRKDEAMLKKPLFVRGLISSGILLHALHDHRWSVTYGLHPVRCLFVVPHRAKGVPAPSAEIGHPDVAIALTCLSYYYDGLEYTQVRTCLELVKKADDPTAEYETLDFYRSIVSTAFDPFECCQSGRSTTVQDPALSCAEVRQEDRRLLPDLRCLSERRKRVWSQAFHVWMVHTNKARMDQRHHGVQWHK